MHMDPMEASQRRRGSGLVSAACILIIVLTHPFHAEAGRLYARVAGTDGPIYNLSVTASRGSVHIENQIAVTSVDEEFYNDNAMILEGYYVFQLPEGARVDGLWLWIDGKRTEFIIKRRDVAERIYEDIVTYQDDPAILETLGANRFQLKVWPINPHSARRIEMRYFEFLPVTQGGRIRYTYPMNMAGYQSTPVATTTLSIDLRSDLPIPECLTNFDDRPQFNTLMRIDDRHFTAAFSARNMLFSEDYTVTFPIDGIYDAFLNHVWANPDSAGEPGYFLLSIPTLPDIAAAGPRDYLLALDASGSMLGDRITLAKAACDTVLRTLRPCDRFRFVLFGLGTLTIPSDTSLLFATPQNIDSALALLELEYYAAGGTNYQEAFRRGLSGNFRPGLDNRLIFLTDGEPTDGATDYASINATIRQYDRTGIRIYPVCLGITASNLLEQIAAGHSGYVTYLASNDELPGAMKRLANLLSTGEYRGAALRFGSSSVSDVRPDPFPSFLRPDRFFAAGRFSNDDSMTVTATFFGTNGAPTSIARPARFLRSNSSLVQVSQFWAALCMDALLADIREKGETPQRVDSVVLLSTKYRVLSPYTAFLVVERRIDAIEPPPGPSASVIRQNYPNPFSPGRSGSTAITYSIGAAGHLRISIFDPLGRCIRILREKDAEAGTGSIEWDGRDETGHLLPSGIYFCLLESSGERRIIRMAMLR